MRSTFFLLVLLISVNGCSSEPPLGKAEGQVTLHGKPMPTGSIIFENTAGGATYVCALDPAGHFRFEVARGYGLPPGNYQVGISPYTPPKPALDFVPPDMNPKTYPNISQRYQNPATSGFVVTV